MSNYPVGMRNEGPESPVDMDSLGDQWAEHVFNPKLAFEAMWEAMDGCLRMNPEWEEQLREMLVPWLKQQQRMDVALLLQSDCKVESFEEWMDA